MSSKIEWTEETWNPVTGCTKISAGCTRCYASRMAQRLAGRFGYPVDDPFRVALHPDVLEKPLRWKKPRRVFVCSMGDLFHDDVNTMDIDNIFYVMEQAEQHTFQVLTKRPARMKEYLCDRWQWGAPSNIWTGTTTENQATADLRLPELLATPAAVRFVSVEPMLEPVNLGLLGTVPGSAPYSLVCERLSWVICGGESGPGARPLELDWVRSLRDQCVAAEVPFFFKQRLDDNKRKISMPELDGVVWDQMPGEIVERHRMLCRGKGMSPPTPGNCYGRCPKDNGYGWSDWRCNG